jgi:hypothetical protein
MKNHRPRFDDMHVGHWGMSDTLQPTLKVCVPMLKVCVLMLANVEFTQIKREKISR